MRLHFTSILLILLVLLSLPLSLRAQIVSEADARHNAADFLQKADRHVPRRGVVRSDNQEDGGADGLSLAYTSQHDGVASYYVFNDTREGGFVIVGGDKRSSGILGYCDHGRFDYSSAPAVLKWWLSQYDQQIAALPSVDEDSSSPILRGADRGVIERHPDVTPLLTTLWDQEEPYNKFVPSGEWATESVAAGCVATAMAQAMKYYNYPAQGTGSSSYTSSGGESKGMNFKTDYGQHTYQWTQMLDNYEVEYSSASGEAVAQLMYDCGVSVKMQYGYASTNGSGSYTDLVPHALATYFGYNRAMTLQNRGYYTDSEWDALIYEELAAGRPVIYSGTQADSDGGHAFVCHGYSSYLDMYAFNWGWSGQADGYYVLSAVSGLTPMTYNFSRYQAAVVGCEPDPEGVSQPCLCLDADVWKTITLQQNGNELVLKVRIENCGSEPARVELGARLRHTVTGQTFCVSSGKITIPLRKIDVSLSFPLDFLSYNGTYEVAPIFRSEGATSEADWQPIRVSLSSPLPTVSVTDRQDPEAVAVEFTLPTQELSLYRRAKFSHSPNYQGAISYFSSDPDIAVVTSDGFVEALSIGQVTLSARAEAASGYLATERSFALTVVPNRPPKISLSANSIEPEKTVRVIVEEDFVPSFNYSSSNPMVATVQGENGTVKALREGKTAIQVVSAEGDAAAQLDLTVLPAPLVVPVGSVGFVELPVLPNDNHPAQGQSSMSYTLINNGDQTLDLGLIYYTVQKGDELLKTGRFGFSDMRPGVSYTSANEWGPVNSISNMLEEGESYEVFFYTDATHTMPANVPSVSFVWSRIRDIELTVPPCGWCLASLPFAASLPQELRTYACSIYAGGSVALQPSVGFEAHRPYVVCGTPGTYQFSGPEIAPRVNASAGLLVANPTTKGRDYQLVKREGVVGFFAASSESTGDIGVTGSSDSPSIILRLPAGLSSYPDQILISDIRQGAQPGDASGDGLVDENDLLPLIDVLLTNKKSAPSLMLDADVNQDGKVSISDLTLLIQQLFRQ